MERANIKKQDLFNDLKMDCEKCFGLCCTALYYAKSEGFPKDKEVGVPCDYLAEDFKCSVHNQLKEKGLHGCMAYECLGAGQKVSQITYEGKNWRQNPKKAKEMFDVFLIMHQLHEFLWYLTEALYRTEDKRLKGEIINLRQETEDMTKGLPNELLKVEITVHRMKVNHFLMKVSEEVSKKAQHLYKGNGNKLARRREWIGADLRKKDLIGANLSGTLLIAANLSGVNLNGATLIGADLRDANLCGAKLDQVLYLTQFQLDTAKGDLKTLIPPHLERPSNWIK